MRFFSAFVLARREPMYTFGCLGILSVTLRIPKHPKSSKSISIQAVPPSGESLTWLLQRVAAKMTFQS